MEKVKKNNILVKRILFVLASILTSSYALAAPGGPNSPQIPDSCKSRLGSKGHNDGVNYQNRKMELRWKRYGRCKNLEEYIESFGDPLSLTSARNIYTRCRYQGRNDEMYRFFRQLSLQCGEDCMDRGQINGEKGALEFCNISLMGEYTAEGVRLCKYATRLACEVNFRKNVNQYCKEKMNRNMTQFIKKLEETCS